MEKDGPKDAKTGQSWVQRLIQLFRSLEGRKNVFGKRKDKGVPQGFGWRESEEEYQERQEEWLRQVEEKKRQKKDNSKG
ncbi:MAG: hypothetical protein ACOCZ2_04960 [Thermodesulfobacteriota bacterium]